MYPLLGELSGTLPGERPPVVIESHIRNVLPFPGNMATGFLTHTTQGGGSEVDGYMIYAVKEQPTRKPPQRQGRLIDITALRVASEQDRVAISNDIDALRQLYLFSDEAIEPFLEDHRAIRTILRQAIDPLRETFGDDKLFNLEVSADDDGSSTLYAVAIWQEDARSASGALHNFLENWWLHRMNASTSDLAFAYKLV